MPRDVTAAELTAALHQLRADVLGLVSTLASESALGAHRQTLRGDVDRDVAAATERVRRELNGLVDTHGEELRSRLALVDSLLESLKTRLTVGDQRIDEVDARVTPARVEGLVAKAARDTAEAVYTERFQEGIDALRGAFDAADDHFQQIRAYVEQFGPGGLPVVSQERDALKRRVDELSAAVEAGQREVLGLKAAVADRDAAALRRRVVDGIDPEAVDRRFAAVAERERDLDVREALETEKKRLATEVERLRAALAGWESTGRAEQSARVDAAQMERYRSEAAAADAARLVAERAKSDALTRMRQAQDEASKAAAELRQVETERASAQERTRRLDALTEEARSFARQWEELKRTQSELERTLKEREAERAGLFAELLALRQEVEVATEKGRRAEAEARAAGLEQTREQLVRWAEAEALSLAATHRAEAERLGAELERKQKALTTREGEISGLTEEHVKVRVALQAAQIELGGLREAHDKRLALLEEEVRAHESRILATAQAEADRARQEAADDAERARQEAADDAERTRAAATAESDRLLALADDAIAARDALVAEIQERSAEKGALTAQLDALHSQFNDLRERVVPEEQRVGALKTPVFHDLKPLFQVDEDAWLKGLEDDIRAAGFFFHPRLLRAFHTSLKIARYAPLVVLAGISGTGKSELPRLYADLGGVPFLEMAVQPSWDSPHDLFGFFNYTDGRLKAEPLARLLWQVGRADDGLRESPSLVLLDEMNLARVEYYFADLLSKLEARRGVRASTDPEVRRRASILVDTGPQGGELPLFLDERVLFVGTMNQDESTLTLSDKVLDRACVLTFPAPRTMRMAAQAAVKPRGQRLAWDTWTGWIREPEEGEHAAKLNLINGVMAELGRPFGHRLFRAIHAYISNYPGDATDAFADQFAMKIIPRLQGLECQGRNMEARLNRLEALVPDALLGAFAAARAHEFFTWAGAPDLYQVDE